MSLNLIFRGLDALTAAEKESIVRQFAVSFKVPVDTTRRMLTEIGSPIWTNLPPAAADQLADRLRAFGITVEIVPASPLNSASGWLCNKCGNFISEGSPFCNTCTPDKIGKLQTSPSNVKSCPFCDELINAQALKCKICKEWLPGVSKQQDSTSKHEPGRTTSEVEQTVFNKSPILDQRTNTNPIDLLVDNQPTNEPTYDRATQVSAQNRLVLESIEQPTQGTSGRSWMENFFCVFISVTVVTILRVVSGIEGLLVNIIVFALTAVVYYSIVDAFKARKRGKASKLDTGV